MRLLRDLSRRRLRTALTISGITIGIWALVVFSAMANKINRLVDGGTAYYDGKIIVTDASAGGIGIGRVPLDMAIADTIAGQPGVAAVDAQVELPFDDGQGAAFGMPNLILGSVAGADRGLNQFTSKPTQGRLLEPRDEGSHVVVLGSDLARTLKATVGDTIEAKGVRFETVGVLEPTLTGQDTTAIVPLAAAQDLFISTLPPSLRGALSARNVATQIVVYPAAGADARTVADTIEATTDNVSTMTSDDFDQQVGATTMIFNAIIIGVALISLVVGGLSVINTMAMTVTERTREIGIKRAIGASRPRIIRELVAEAGMIGLIGGAVGLVLGAIVVLVANELGRSSGTLLFELTPGTAVFAVAFSTILGMLAGVVPAWNAARLDPVAALRYQ